MQTVKVKGVQNPLQFPDDMTLDQIKEVILEKVATPTNMLALERQVPLATANDPTLQESTRQKIFDLLSNSGLISDKHGAMQVADNISTLLGFLPGTGTAFAGDEAGRALKEGDYLTAGINAISEIPGVGEALGAGAAGIARLKNVAPEVPKLSDKMKIKRDARRGLYKLPTKGDVANIKHITDLSEYDSQQLVNQMKLIDQPGIRHGGYLKRGDKLNVFYKDDGTSQFIDTESGNVLMDIDQEQTSNMIKNDVLELAEKHKTPEQIESEFLERKRNDAINEAREKAQAETYKMQHTAPLRGDNPTGEDITSAFGDDIYTGNAVRYFGHGVDYDQKAINFINQMKGNPDKEITIYRAVPKSVNEINPSDWVTTTKEYAEDHMAGEKGWHIISKKVKARDLATDGNSIHEWGYSPE